MAEPLTPEQRRARAERLRALMGGGEQATSPAGTPAPVAPVQPASTPAPAARLPSAPSPASAPTLPAPAPPRPILDPDPKATSEAVGYAPYSGKTPRVGPQTNPRLAGSGFYVQQDERTEGQKASDEAMASPYVSPEKKARMAELERQRAEVLSGRSEIGSGDHTPILDPQEYPWLSYLARPNWTWMLSPPMQAVGMGITAVGAYQQAKEGAPPTDWAGFTGFSNGERYQALRQIDLERRVLQHETNEFTTYSDSLYDQMERVREIANSRGYRGPALSDEYTKLYEYVVDNRAKTIARAESDLSDLRRRLNIGEDTHLNVQVSSDGKVVVDIAALRYRLNNDIRDEKAREAGYQGWANMKSGYARDHGYASWTAVPETEKMVLEAKRKEMAEEASREAEVRMLNAFQYNRNLTVVDFDQKETNDWISQLPLGFKTLASVLVPVTAANYTPTGVEFKSERSSDWTFRFMSFGSTMVVATSKAWQASEGPHYFARAFGPESLSAGEDYGSRSYAALMLAREVLKMNLYMDDDVARVYIAESRKNPLVAEYLFNQMLALGDASGADPRLTKATAFAWGAIGLVTDFTVPDPIGSSLSVVGGLLDGAGRLTKDAVRVSRLIEKAAEGTDSYEDFISVVWRTDPAAATIIEHRVAARIDVNASVSGNISALQADRAAAQARIDAIEAMDEIKALRKELGRLPPPGGEVPPGREKVYALLKGLAEDHAKVAASELAETRLRLEAAEETLKAYKEGPDGQAGRELARRLTKYKESQAKLQEAEDAFTAVAAKNPKFTSEWTDLFDDVADASQEEATAKAARKSLDEVLERLQKALDDLEADYVAKNGSKDGIENDMPSLKAWTHLDRAQKQAASMDAAVTSAASRRLAAGKKLRAVEKTVSEDFLKEFKEARKIRNRWRPIVSSQEQDFATRGVDPNGSPTAAYEAELARLKKDIENWEELVRVAKIEERGERKTVKLTESLVSRDAKDVEIAEKMKAWKEEVRAVASELREGSGMFARFSAELDSPSYANVLGEAVLHEDIREARRWLDEEEARRFYMMDKRIEGMVSDIRSLGGEAGTFPAGAQRQNGMMRHLLRLRGDLHQAKIAYFPNPKEIARIEKELIKAEEALSGGLSSRRLKNPDAERAKPWRDRKWIPDILDGTVTDVEKPFPALFIEASVADNALNEERALAEISKLTNTSWHYPEYFHEFIEAWALGGEAYSQSPVYQGFASIPNLRPGMNRAWQDAIHGFQNVLKDAKDAVRHSPTNGAVEDIIESTVELLMKYQGEAHACLLDDTSEVTSAGLRLYVSSVLSEHIVSLRSAGAIAEGLKEEAKAEDRADAIGEVLRQMLGNIQVKVKDRTIRLSDRIDLAVAQIAEQGVIDIGESGEALITISDKAADHVQTLFHEVSHWFLYHMPETQLQGIFSDYKRSLYALRNTVDGAELPDLPKALSESGWTVSKALDELTELGVDPTPEQLVNSEHFQEFFAYCAMESTAWHVSESAAMLPREEKIQRGLLSTISEAAREYLLPALRRVSNSVATLVEGAFTAAGRKIGALDYSKPPTVRFRARVDRAISEILSQRLDLTVREAGGAGKFNMREKGKTASVSGRILDNTFLKELPPVLRELMPHETQMDKPKHAARIARGRLRKALEESASFYSRLPYWAEGKNPYAFALDYPMSPQGQAAARKAWMREFEEFLKSDEAAMGGYDQEMQSFLEGERAWANLEWDDIEAGAVASEGQRRSMLNSYNEGVFAKFPKTFPKTLEEFRKVFGAVSGQEAFGTRKVARHNTVLIPAVVDLLRTLGFENVPDKPWPLTSYINSNGWAGGIAQKAAEYYSERLLEIARNVVGLKFTKESQAALDADLMTKIRAVLDTAVEEVKDGGSGMNQLPEAPVFPGYPKLDRLLVEAHDAVKKVSRVAAADFQGTLFSPKAKGIKTQAGAAIGTSPDDEEWKFLQKVHKAIDSRAVGSTVDEKAAYDVMKRAWDQKGHKLFSDPVEFMAWVRTGLDSRVDLKLLPPEMEELIWQLKTYSVELSDAIIEVVPDLARVGVIEITEEGARVAVPPSYSEDVRATAEHLDNLLAIERASPSEVVASVIQRHRWSADGAIPEAIGRVLPDLEKEVDSKVLFTNKKYRPVTDYLLKNRFAVPRSAKGPGVPVRGKFYMRSGGPPDQRGLSAEEVRRMRELRETEAGVRQVARSVPRQLIRPEDAPTVLWDRIASSGITLKEGVPLPKINVRVNPTLTAENLNRAAERADYASAVPSALIRNEDGSWTIEVLNMGLAEKDLNRHFATALVESGVVDMSLFDRLSRAAFADDASVDTLVRMYLKDSTIRQGAAEERLIAGDSTLMELRKKFQRIIADAEAIKSERTEQEAGRLLRSYETASNLLKWLNERPAGNPLRALLSDGILQNFVSMKLKTPEEYTAALSRLSEIEREVRQSFIGDQSWITAPITRSEEEMNALSALVRSAAGISVSWGGIIAAGLAASADASVSANVLKMMLLVMSSVPIGTTIGLIPESLQAAKSVMQARAVRALGPEEIRKAAKALAALQTQKAMAVMETERLLSGSDSLWVPTSRYYGAQTQPYRKRFLMRDPAAAKALKEHAGSHSTRVRKGTGFVTAPGPMRKLLVGQYGEPAWEALIQELRTETAPIERSQLGELDQILRRIFMDEVYANDTSIGRATLAADAFKADPANWGNTGLKLTPQEAAILQQQLPARMRSLRWRTDPGNDALQTFRAWKLMRETDPAMRPRVWGRTKEGSLWFDLANIPGAVMAAISRTEMALHPQKSVMGLNLSEEAGQIIKASVNTSAHVDDELLLLVQNVVMEDIPPEHIERVCKKLGIVMDRQTGFWAFISDYNQIGLTEKNRSIIQIAALTHYMDSPEAIRLSVQNQKTIVNTMSNVSVWESARLQMLSDGRNYAKPGERAAQGATVDPSVISGGSVGSDQFSGAFIAMSRIWLPSSEKVKIADADLRRLAEAAFKLLQKNYAEGGTFLDFVMAMKGQTQHIVRNSEYGMTRAFGFAARAAAHAFVLQGAIENIGRIQFARVTPEAATDIQRVFSANFRKASPESLRRAIAALNDLGTPMSQTSAITQRRTGELGKTTLQAITIGMNPRGEEVWTTAMMLKELEQNLPAVIKESHAHSAAPVSLPSYFGRGAANSFLSAWKTSAVTGLLIPNPRYWVNNVFGDMSQIWFGQGGLSAAKLSFQNLPANIPILGREWQNYGSQFALRSGGVPVLGTLTNAMFNPWLHAVWNNVDEVFQSRNGMIVTVQDARKWLVEDGILDTFVHEELQQVFSRVAPGWAQRILGGFGTQESIGQFAAFVQQRQRAALYLELLRTGATRAEARRATLDALFDWKNGVSEAEVSAYFRMIPFYRFWRLSLTQMAGAFLDPLIKPGQEFRASLTGDTKLGRVRNQHTVWDRTVGATQFYVREALAEEYEEQENERLALMQYTAEPWMRAKGPTLPFSLSEEDSRHFQRTRGKWYDSAYISMPRSTSLDTLPVLMLPLTLFGAIKAHLTGQPLTPDWHNQIWGPLSGSLHPAMSEPLDTYYQTQISAAGKASGGSARYSPTEAAMANAFSSLTGGTHKDPETGEDRGSPMALTAFRMFPFFGIQLAPLVDNAVVDNPATDLAWIQYRESESLMEQSRIIQSVNPEEAQRLREKSDALMKSAIAQLPWAATWFTLRWMGLGPYPASLEIQQQNRARTIGAILKPVEESTEPEFPGWRKNPRDIKVEE